MRLTKPCEALTIEDCKRESLAAIMSDFVIVPNESKSSLPAQIIEWTVPSIAEIIAKLIRCTIKL